MASLIDTWALESQEGFEQYMKHLGVGMVKRKLGSTLKPDFIVSKDGDTWKMVTTSSFRTSEVTFQEGVEFDEITADDRTVKATITFDGEKMVHAQKDPANAANDTVIERVVDGGKLVTTVKCGDLVSKRVYAKK